MMSGLIALLKGRFEQCLHFNLEISISCVRDKVRQLAWKLGSMKVNLWAGKPGMRFMFQL